MREVRGWLLFAVTFPYSVVVGWGFVLLMWSIYAAHALRFDRFGVLTAVWRPWAAKRWRFSTALGRGVVYQPSGRRRRLSAPRTTTESHEAVHVRQIEDLMLTSLVVGVVVAAVTGNWILGLVLWFSGGAWQLPAFVTAGLRHGWTLHGVYRQSEHEMSAYAQTSRWSGERSYLEEWHSGLGEVTRLRSLGRFPGSK